jgi:hypothetical protein
MSYASDQLRRITNLNGDGRPKDAAYNYQLAVLREILSVVEDVLNEEHVPDEVAERIIRTVIYGGRPHRADADQRIELTAELADALSRQMPVPRFGPPV